MKLLPLLALAILLSGCAHPPDAHRDWPVVPKLPPRPPERAMRRAPDFTWHDHAAKKEYILRLHTDPGFVEELVTVVDRTQPGEGERLATLDERDEARAAFEREWKRLGWNEQIQYYNELQRRGRERSATLLQDQIRLTRHALEDLQGRKTEIDAVINARRETGACADRTEENAFLASESTRLAEEISLQDARLKLLEYELSAFDR